MGLMANKNGILVSFCHKLTFFGKTEGSPLNFELKFEIF
jgi:hypothetical protein